MMAFQYFDKNLIAFNLTKAREKMEKLKKEKKNVQNKILNVAKHMFDILEVCLACLLRF